MCDSFARETIAHFQFWVEPDDVSTKDAFNRIPVGNLYLLPRGFGNLVRGFGAGIDISLSTPVKTSIGTRMLCGCIRRMASFALARRSSPRKQWYWLVGVFGSPPNLSLIHI